MLAAVDALHDERKSVLCTETDTGSAGTRTNSSKLANAERVSRRARRIANGSRNLRLDGRARIQGGVSGQLGANSGFYAPYEDNAKRWYKKVQRSHFVNHAIVNRRSTA